MYTISKLFAGGNRTEAGLASHRLGNIYEAVGDPEVATMYHKGKRLNKLIELGYFGNCL